MTARVGSINDRRILDNDIKSTEYLQVNCCGIFERTAESYRTYRPYGRKDYQIIIIASGGAVFKHNNQKIQLLSGEMLLIPPFKTNDYTYTNPVDAVWIHFSGSEVENILNTYDIKPFVPHVISDVDSLILYAEMIIKEFQLKKVGYMNNCNGYLLNILTSLKRQIDSNNSIQIKSPHSDFAPIIEDMKTNFHKRKSIPEYAEMLHMSVSRFTHLFTETFGICGLENVLKDYCKIDNSHITLIKEYYPLIKNIIDNSGKLETLLDKADEYSKNIY